MYRFILGMTLIAAGVPALADGVEGTWRTEENSAGGYLEVTVGPCKSDAKKICGTISNAFTKAGPDAGYENLGKLMVQDMVSTDGVSYSGGTIWDPEKNKTYKAKMHLKGDELDVAGCISIVCSGQDWKRVK